MEALGSGGVNVGTLGHDAGPPIPSCSRMKVRGLVV